MVVSPLIALTQDPVTALLEFGNEAGFLNSTQSPDEGREMMRRLRGSKLQPAFPSLHWLLNDEKRVMSRKVRLALPSAESLTEVHASRKMAVRPGEPVFPYDNAFLKETLP